MIKRIYAHVRRLLRARRFRIPFVRAATFRMPKSVRINGRNVEIASPTEHGASSDFLTCFIVDEYGLSDTTAAIKTIADIGANIGFFSMAARSYFPEAEIHAYEPNPRILPYTRQNAAKAGFQLYPEAVGSTAGTVDIEDSSDSNQARTVTAGVGTSGIAQVSLATAVERLGGTIDLAKIDCEGAEWDLFNVPEPWSVIRFVRMEYHLWGKHKYSEVEEAFARLGFKIEHHVSSGEWGTVWCRNVRS